MGSRRGAKKGHVARQLIAFGRLKLEYPWPTDRTTNRRRKTTNRLRAIETQGRHLHLAPHTFVARQLIAFGRLKLQSEIRGALSSFAVARQLIAFGRLKPRPATWFGRAPKRRKTTNRLRAIETPAFPNAPAHF